MSSFIPEWQHLLTEYVCYCDLMHSITPDIQCECAGPESFTGKLYSTELHLLCDALLYTLHFLANRPSCVIARTWPSC